MEEYKVIVIGDESVGKSSLILRLAEAAWIPDYSPTIQDTYRTTIEHLNEQYLLDILDTAGCDDYSHMRDLYMKQCNGVICVFDICSSKSFISAAQKLQHFMKFKGLNRFPIILVGNKSDIAENRQVSKQQANELAKKFNTIYVEASAKLNVHVNDTFVQLLSLILKSNQLLSQNIHVSNNENNSNSDKIKSIRSPFALLRQRLLSLVC